METSGRDAGETLPRARLAATLEWADTAGEDAAVNRSERAFLEESRPRSRARTGACGPCSRWYPPAQDGSSPAQWRCRSRVGAPPGHGGDRPAARCAGARRAAAPDRALLLARRARSSTDRSRRGAISSPRSCAAPPPSRCSAAAARSRRRVQPRRPHACCPRRRRQRGVLRRPHAARGRAALRVGLTALLRRDRATRASAGVQPRRPHARRRRQRRPARDAALLDTSSHRARATTTTVPNVATGRCCVRAGRQDARHRRGRLGLPPAAGRAARVPPAGATAP